MSNSSSKGEIEHDKEVAVVIFDSADRDFFLAHYDIAADQSAFGALPAAPTPFHHWADFLIRLAKSRAVTITALRGRARGAGSEFALATDIRFASRERAVLGQFEVGFAFDLLALADIKRFVNAASLPADAALTAEMDAFAEAVARPATPSLIGRALEQGFQQRSDVELDLGAYIGKVFPKPANVSADQG